MSSTFTRAFGRAIAAERKFRDLTQVELGERLGWSDSTISAIETGDRPVAVGTLPEICVALDCGILDLLRRAEDRDRQALRL